jgi:hypothetical protein
MSKLSIPYDRYWICRSYRLCPECGKDMDIVKDKCCKVCHRCWQANKWDEIDIPNLSHPMRCNKNKDDFEWSFRIVFNDKVDEHIFTILQDYGCEIVDDTTDSIYFR